MSFWTGACLICAAAAASSAGAGEKPRPTGPEKVDAAPAASEDVDAYVQRLMQKRHVPGASVAVVRDGKVVLSKGYGLANVELNVPATAGTVYQLASVTKTFTATAVMMLVKDGTLSLDDKITERLPDLPGAWKDVTVRHLLNHTSGIKSYTSIEEFHKSPGKDYAPRELIDLVAKEPLEFPPGEKWNYSNTGYVLLGMLIEKVSGRSYGEFMAERVFKPLGMGHTRANDLRAVVPNRAQGYHWDGKVLKNGEYVSPTQPFAAGMLISTVEDLTKWAAAVTGHALLDGPTVERMWAPTRLKGGKEAEYGFGWGVSKVNGRRQIAHGGGIPGFATQFSLFPDDGLAVIVLTNADGGHAGSLARGIAGRFVPALAEKVEPIADQDVPTTERLRGVLEGAMKGAVDPELFTDEGKKALVPRLSGARERLATLGALKGFQLLERKEDHGALRLRYRAVFENDRLTAFYTLDRDGKIQGFGLQPDD